MTLNITAYSGVGQAQVLYIPPREVDVTMSLAVAIGVTTVLQLVLIFSGEFVHDARNRMKANQGDIASQVSGQLYEVAYNHSLNNSHDLYPD